MANNALRLRDHAGGAFVEGLSEHGVSSPLEAARLLVRGADARRTGETMMNRASSRSHSVFTVHLFRRARAGAGSKAEPVERLSQNALDKH